MKKLICILILASLLSITLISAARLPNVDGDEDSWGTILNEYLSKLSGANATELNQTMVNGSNIYDSTINTTHLLDKTITGADLADDSVNSSAIDLTEVTLTDFTNDANYLDKDEGGTIDGSLIINGNLSLIGSYLNATVTNQHLNGSFLPTITNLFDFGSSSSLWRNLYITKIFATDWSNVTITESQVSDADWWDADADLTADEISEANINFATSCGAGNHIYIDGNDLACEVDATGGNSSFNQSLTDTLYWKSDGTSTASGNWDIGSYNLTTNTIFPQQDIRIGNATERDQYIYFYEDGSATGENIRWDESSDLFIFSDAIWVQGTSALFDGDILTTGAGDDLWLGTATQEDANFIAYADGRVNSTSNITAQYFLGDGSQLTGMSSGGNDSWNQSLADTLYWKSDGTSTASGNWDLNNKNLTNIEYLKINQSDVGYGMMIENDTNWGKMDIGSGGYFDIDSSGGFFFRQNGGTIAWFSTSAFGQLMYALPISLGSDYNNAHQWGKWTNNKFQLKNYNTSYGVLLEINDSGDFDFQNNTIRNATFIGDGSQLTGISGGDGTGGWTNTSTETNTTLNVNINNANISVGDFSIQSTSHANVTQLIIEDYFAGTYYGIAYINDSQGYRRIRGNITEYV